MASLAAAALVMSNAHAGRAASSQACADRMAEFAESAALTPTTKVKLTAAERESAETIRELLPFSVPKPGEPPFDFTARVAPELRRALERAPQLLERDPDSAFRFAMAILFYATWQERDLHKLLVKSGLRFEGAKLSKAEVQKITQMLRDYDPYNSSGLLGRPLHAVELPWRTETAVKRSFEKARASVTYSFFQVVAAHADPSAKVELAKLFEFTRMSTAANGRHYYPMQALRNGFSEIAPWGTTEGMVWDRAFRRLFDSTEPPFAVAHALEDGRIRVSSSDPFEGAKAGVVGFERIFKASDFRKLAESSGPDGVVLRVGEDRGALRIPRSVLSELTSSGGVAKATGNAPPYEAWARDGKIQGLVWTDTGFESKDAAETLGEYLSFYRAKGFNFKKQQVTNFPEWIESRVKSGELDYMVREGHQQQVLSMARSGELMIGRKAGNPLQEIVLFLPSARSRDAELSWTSMAQALKARSGADGESSLLYFDTKCSSFHGAACALPKLVNSSNLQMVSVKGTASTFVNDQSSPLRALMEGILEQDGYSKMNSRLQAARKRAAAAADDAAADDYIFPNSEEYLKGVIEKALPGGELEWVAK